MVLTAYGIMQDSRHILPLACACALSTCHRHLRPRFFFFFFCLFMLAFDLYSSWRRTFCPVFLTAVRAVAARCKLLFVLRPGLSQEKVDVPKGIDKGKNQRKARPVPYSSPTDAMNYGVGRNSGSSSPSPLSSTAPSASTSPSRSSCRPRRSRSSHSDAVFFFQ